MNEFAINPKCFKSGGFIASFTDSLCLQAHSVPWLPLFPLPRLPPFQGSLRSSVPSIHSLIPRLHSLLPHSLHLEMPLQSEIMSQLCCDWSNWVSELIGNRAQESTSQGKWADGSNKYRCIADAQCTCWGVSNHLAGMVEYSMDRL